MMDTRSPPLARAIYENITKNVAKFTTWRLTFDKSRVIKGA